MPFPFLSPEWIAAAKDVRARYADRATRVEQVIRVNQVITDVPFGDGTVSSHLDTSSGTPVLELGELAEADATITTDYETAKAIFVDLDQAAGMQAFMAGKIKVQGDMMKVIALQTAIPHDEVGQEIAQQIKAITA